MMAERHDNGNAAEGQNNGNVILVCSDSDSEESVDNDGGVRYIKELTAEEIMEKKFSCLDEACDFYKNYARLHGFVTRKHVRELDGMKNIVMRELVCNREGEREKKYIDRVDRVRDHKDVTRTNCKAKIRFRFDHSKQKWRVASFVGQHNHELTPATQMHLHPKNRGLTSADKAQVESMSLHGVRPCQIMGYMRGQKGGYAALGFTNKDLYNYIQKHKCAKREDGDAVAALSYLSGKSENDPLHFTMYTINEEDGSIGNLFWADGCSRTDYECFGDVLSFDSTYKRNKYDRPLVILSGCNNHGQTVVFGCAILNDEKTETYKWLLEVFLQAMYGKHPPTVVTDGDGAMRDAIKYVFPNAWHRLCAWHLHKNAGDNVKNASFLTDFKKVLYENLTVDEFEETWAAMMNRHGLASNKWVEKTYANKEMWAHAYTCDKFFAGIRTTSRCEGVNNFINKYVKRTNSLIEFVVNFERAVEQYRHNELAADFKSTLSFPVMTPALQELEENAAKTYTRKNFSEVKIQIIRAGAHEVKSTVVVDDIATMNVARYGYPLDEIPITYDAGESKFVCQCRLYESRGIPCAHIFSVLRHAHLTSIPSSLILKRWTQNAKSEHIAAVTAEDSEAHNGFMLRFAALSAECNMLYKLGAENIHDFIELEKEISTRIAVFLKRGDNKSNHVEGKKIIGDPNFVKSKGAPRKRKRKGSRRRKCSGCGRTGHYIRTCPKFRTVVDKDTANDNTGSSSDGGDALDDERDEVA